MPIVEPQHLTLYIPEKGHDEMLEWATDLEQLS